MTAAERAKADALAALLQAGPDAKAKGAMHALYNEAELQSIDGGRVFAAVAGIAAEDFSEAATQAAVRKLFGQTVPASLTHLMPATFEAEGEAAEKRLNESGEAKEMEAAARDAAEEKADKHHASHAKHKKH